VGPSALQSTKLLLSLLSHAGRKWWAAADSHLVAVRQHFSPGKSRDFTVKVCSPNTPRDSGDSVPRGISKWSQPTVTLRPGLAYETWRLT